MRLASISENLNIEKRISITPDIVKKYMSLGFEITLPKNYGFHLGINDKDYLDLGVKILDDEDEIIMNSDILVQHGFMPDEKISLLKENQILIGVFNPHNNSERITDIKKKKSIFFLWNYFLE